MNVEQIYDLLGIREGYQLPDRLLQVLEANEHGAICELLSSQKTRAFCYLLQKI